MYFRSQRHLVKFISQDTLFMYLLGSGVSDLTLWLYMSDNICTLCKVSITWEFMSTQYLTSALPRNIKSSLHQLPVIYPQNKPSAFCCAKLSIFPQNWQDTWKPSEPWLITVKLKVSFTWHIHHNNQWSI